MIRIIDNTLTAFDDCLPSKEDLYTFCNLLFTIGVDVVEFSIAAYERMELLPKEGKYILNVEYADEINKYPGFYKYVTNCTINQDTVIHEVQMNDAREIVKLRALTEYRELRIVGLDDLICESYDRTMNEIKKILSKSKINFCPENTYGCASALALQWVLNSGTDITTSFAGHKNNGATEEVIMALRLAIRHKPNRDLTVLPQLKQIYERITNSCIGNKKPILGKNIFQVEAGIHADGLHKNPDTYEAYQPGWVGGKTEFVIGKHSGMKAIKLKLEELNMPIPIDSNLNEILYLIKETCTLNRKSLNDQEFERIVIKVIGNERIQTYY
ncbi:homocitrate synthase NifV [Mobilisporobacter senegalensis]|uniref:Homocitrate synthase NifV n=1 Tax=Mobilisporobacter senegalensis TaxID=1329262 RepID=A0A3N1XP31_9FIRM|nr:hypothetical protein [Mobilisporobacter senegalensis]ROR28450.1 homocitrate synthase NifV [Mobilisporobacter senegalensis]